LLRILSSQCPICLTAQTTRKVQDQKDQKVPESTIRMDPAAMRDKTVATVVEAEVSVTSTWRDPKWSTATLDRLTQTVLTTIICTENRKSA
jgi:hypothetical protein